MLNISAITPAEPDARFGRCEPLWPSAQHQRREAYQKGPDQQAGDRNERERAAARPFSGRGSLTMRRGVVVDALGASDVHLSVQVLGQFRVPSRGQPRSNAPSPAWLRVEVPTAGEFATIPVHDEAAHCAAPSGSGGSQPAGGIGAVGPREVGSTPAKRTVLA